MEALAMCREARSFVRVHGIAMELIAHIFIQLQQHLHIVIKILKFIRYSCLCKNLWVKAKKRK